MSARFCQSLYGRSRYLIALAFPALVRAAQIAGSYWATRYAGTAVRVALDACEVLALLG